MIQGNSNDLALNGRIFHEPIDFPEISGSHFPFQNATFWVAQNQNSCEVAS